jgi:hypothetical protein
MLAPIKLLLLVLTVAANASVADPPETVVVTYHPLAGKEAAVAQVLREQRETLARLDLMAPGTCHVTYVDGAAFVDVFTWKSHATPDNAPEEILALWTRLNALVQKENGIEIREVTLP